VFAATYAPARGEVRPLVDRARTGDPDAWEALYRRSYPRLLAYARRRLPTTDLAHDAVGEAVTRAVAGIERFRGQGGGFDAWMYGIVRHVVLDLQRRSRREGPGAVPDAPDLAGGPGDTVLGREEAARLRAAFARLDPDDREILELRVVMGLSSEEAAAALGRRPGAIRMAQSRALGRLRALLEAGDGEGRVAIA
jgi:RNA polymerase sigma-70 factor, ECF subfamily